MPKTKRPCAACKVDFLPWRSCQVYCPKCNPVTQQKRVDRARVVELFLSGLTQEAVAKELGCCVNSVRNHLKRAGCNRDQIRHKGEQNHRWTGDAATYHALHCRVAKLRGKPSLCEHCATTTGEFHWANATGNYLDPTDYIRLCTKCHGQYDSARRRVTGKTTSAEYDHRAHETAMIGENHYASRLTEAGVLEIRRAFAGGESQSAIGRRLNIRQSHISAIVNRRIWKHI